MRVFAQSNPDAPSVLRICKVSETEFSEIVLLKEFGFFDSVLFLKMILGNFRNLCRFNSDLNDAFLSRGFIYKK